MFSLLKPHEDMQRMVLRPRTWNAGAVIVSLERNRGICFFNGVKVTRCNTLLSVFYFRRLLFDGLLSSCLQ